MIVGSANLSERAFSGKQAETLLVFDDDERAWAHYEQEYEAVRRASSAELALPDISRTEVPLDDLPIVQEAKQSPDGTTLYVNSDVTAASVPVITRKVERLAARFAAKEAARKALGDLQLGFRDTEVVTAEDPIEYAIEGVQQSQVTPEIGFGFGNTMRAFVREAMAFDWMGVRDASSAGP